MNKIPLIEAASNNDITEVKRLLSSGVNPNIHVSGDTALIVASAYSGSTSSQETVETLIAAGADVNIQNDWGDTALTMASRQEIVEVLIAAGANLNSRNIHGNTALMSTILHRKRSTCQKIVEALIAAGADPNIQNKSGETALSLAISRQVKSVIDSLIAAGAIVHKKTTISPQLLTELLEYKKTAISPQLLTELLEYKKLYKDLVSNMQSYAPDGDGAREAESHFNSLV
jgi:ankyrin repeat protein